MNKIAIALTAVLIATILCLEYLPAFRSLKFSKHSSGFTVVDGNILDSKGKKFIARGMNLQYHNKKQFLGDIKDIARYPINLIRLQVYPRKFHGKDLDGKPYYEHKTPISVVKKALDLTIGYKLVPMLYPYSRDITCRAHPKRLDAAVDWWVKHQKDFNTPKYAKKLMINITNEWSRLDDPARGYPGTSDEEFLQANLKAIKKIRAAGYKNPLIIDALHCGNLVKPLFTRIKGKTIIERLTSADPQKKIIIGIHAFWKWNSDVQQRKNLYKLMVNKVPFMITEHGNHLIKKDKNKNIDLHALYSMIHQYQIGTIAWSWYGNGDGLEILDIFDPKKKRLTKYGKIIIWGKDGIPKEHSFSGTPKRLAH